MGIRSLTNIDNRKYSPYLLLCPQPTDCPTHRRSSVFTPRRPLRSSPCSPFGTPAAAALLPAFLRRPPLPQARPGPAPPLCEAGRAQHSPAQGLVPPSVPQAPLPTPGPRDPEGGLPPRRCSYLLYEHSPLSRITSRCQYLTFFFLTHKMTVSRVTPVGSS